MKSSYCDVSSKSHQLKLRGESDYKADDLPEDCALLASFRFVSHGMSRTFHHLAAHHPLPYYNQGVRAVVNMDPQRREHERVPVTA
jgi:hypothetical protein